MKIDGSKLGDIEIADEKIITLEEGLPGFADAHRCVLVDARPGAEFKWMLFVDRPELAFVVADPFAFFPDYEAPVAEGDLEAVGFSDGDELALLSVITIRGRRKEDTTFNLRAPIVVNMKTCSGKQFVLKDDKWGVRVPMPPAAAEAGGDR
jgi:flagellar assembly factor FliW